MEAQTENREKCLNCKYFLRNAADLNGNGICRRYPPSIIVAPEMMRGLTGKPVIDIRIMYPTVSRESLCGEFVDVSPTPLAPLPMEEKKKRTMWDPRDKPVVPVPEEKT